MSYLHSRDVTYATFCEGPYEDSVRYRDFVGWDVPWYSAQDSADALLAGRSFAMLACSDRIRPAGTLGGLARRLAPKVGADAAQWRTNGRPTAQWSRVEAGRSDDLGTARR